jgi:glycine/D-amino acid oxidase-like deaminating enzyme
VQLPCHSSLVAHHDARPAFYHRPAAGHSARIVASPCSGHGFKFAPVIGEVIADLATTGTTSHDISRFSIGRFARNVPR